MVWLFAMTKFLVGYLEDRSAWLRDLWVSNFCFCIVQLVLSGIFYALVDDHFSIHTISFSFVILFCDSMREVVSEYIFACDFPNSSLYQSTTDQTLQWLTHMSVPNHQKLAYVSRRYWEPCMINNILKPSHACLVIYSRTNASMNVKDWTNIIWIMKRSNCLHVKWMNSLYWCPLLSDHTIFRQCWTYLFLECFKIAWKMHRINLLVL